MECTPKSSRKSRGWEAIEFVTSADQPRDSRRTSFSSPVGPFVRSKDGRCGVGGVEDDAVAMFPRAEVIVEARLRGWTAGDWSGEVCGSYL